MNHSAPKYLYFSGLLIPFWLSIGVIVAGNIYPDYSHLNFAMSQLGAVGSPTQFLSPIINNYPLGLLFIIFGISVFRSFPTSRLTKLTAVLLVMHGIGSICAGYFPCDAGCNPESPSLSQNLHNLSGLVMALTLVIASSVWAYLSIKLVGLKWFSVFSVICTFVALAVIPAMGSAIEGGGGFGLYQRINYGASVIWVATLAVVLYQHSSKKD